LLLVAVAVVGCKSREDRVVERDDPAAATIAPPLSSARRRYRGGRIG